MDLKQSLAIIASASLVLLPSCRERQNQGETFHLQETESKPVNRADYDKVRTELSKSLPQRQRDVLAKSDLSLQELKKAGQLRFVTANGKEVSAAQYELNPSAHFVILSKPESQNALVLKPTVKMYERNGTQKVQVALFGFVLPKQEAATFSVTKLPKMPTINRAEIVSLNPDQAQTERLKLDQFWKKLHQDLGQSLASTHKAEGLKSLFDLLIPTAYANDASGAILGALIGLVLIALLSNRDSGSRFDSILWISGLIAASAVSLI